MQRTAVISDCGKFRYRLGRRWGDGATLAFVMLNPSTADASKDDNTIRRCIGFAQDLGFAAIEVTNLFAYRSTSPVELRKAGFPIGPQNDVHIEASARSAAEVIVAWGRNADRCKQRAADVFDLIRRAGAHPKALAILMGGQPLHPLMAPGDCKPQYWVPRTMRPRMIDMGDNDGTAD